MFCTSQIDLQSLQCNLYQNYNCFSLSLSFFCRNGQADSKIHTKFQGTENKRILEKKNKVGGLTRPNLKTYCKTIVAKTLWYWHKGRHSKQENRNEIPEIYKSLVDWNLTRMLKLFKGRNNSSFNNWCWDTWTSTCKRLVRSLSHITYKINSKWIKDLM